MVYFRGGKMRITEKRTEPKTNIDYYYGEFGFNAVNEEDEFVREKAGFYGHFMILVTDC